MALRRVSAEWGGSRGAAAGAGLARCGPRLAVAKGFLSTLNARFSRRRSSASKPLFSRAVRTVAWDPVTGCGCRFRAARLSIGWKNARSKVGLHNLAPVGGPEFAIGRKHAVIPMPVPPRRRDKIREPVEELER